MSSAVLTGLIKYPRPDTKIKEIYRRSLIMLRKMPNNSCYRINTEAIICHRFAIVNEARCFEEIESRIGCGQIGILVSQAEAEYSLIIKMMSWKPWDPLYEKPPKHQWTWPPTKT